MISGPKPRLDGSGRFSRESDTVIIVHAKGIIEIIGGFVVKCDVEKVRRE
jgi:hypothetical protein